MFPRLWSVAEVAADGPQHRPGIMPNGSVALSPSATLAREHSYNARGRPELSPLFMFAVRC